MAYTVKILGQYGSDIIVYNDSKHPVFDIADKDKDKIYINGMKVSDVVEYGSAYDSIVTTRIDSSTSEEIPGVGEVYDVIMYDSATHKRKENPYPESNDSSLWIDERQHIPGTYSEVSLYSDLEDVTSKIGDFRLSELESNANIFFIHIDSETDVKLYTGWNNDEDGTSNIKRITITYSPNLPDNYPANFYSLRRVDKFQNDDTSYSLLRCNPKLTGNVKVVVDSSSNIFLDTFKVSKALSQLKYRKIKLNPEEYYGRALMTRYNSVPSTDFYKIEDSCYDIFTFSDTLSGEYYDKYNYGVRTNTDKLYSENFSFLAPLCIKRNMPDFFLIFKIKNYSSIQNDYKRLEYFLENGEIVKSYDMRKESNLGKLIRNIYNHSKDFVGDVYIPYDYDKNIIYNGLSLERGVVSEIYESAASERNLKSQVDMDDWYTLGYERNRIVSKDIINLEFMFDDKEEDIFSLNTYFGLYVKLNGQPDNFSCIGIKGGKNTFDLTIPDETYKPLDFKSVIYGFSDKNEFHRLKNKNIVLATDEIAPYVLKPDKNLASAKIIKNIREEYGNKKFSYASLTLKEPFEAGEHYRVIDNTNKKIYEVIISNYESEENIDIPTEHIYENGYTVYRTSIHNATFKKLLKDWDESLLNEHSNLLKEAFISLGNAYNKNLKAYSFGNKFSITFGEEYGSNIRYILEKVSSCVGFTADEKKYLETYDEDCFDFYGISTGMRLYLSNSSGNPTFPYDFEHLGDRIGYFTDFIQLNSSTPSNFQYIVDVNLKPIFDPYKSVLYRTEDDSEYTLYSKTYEYQALDGFGNESAYLILLDKKPLIFNDRIHFYSAYPINSGVCSIFPVFDIDTYVQDTNSKITSDTATPERVITRRSEFETENSVTDTPIFAGIQEEYFSDYLDKSQNYNLRANEPLTSGYCKTFYKNMLNGNHKRSDIPLMCNYCCKWESVGTSYIGKPMRVMYNMSTSLKNKSYYIAQDSSAYVGFITVNDVSTGLNYNQTCKYINDYGVPYTYKNFVKNMESGVIGIESMLNIPGTISGNKFSKAYKFGDNALEFISGGIKINVETTNKTILDVTRYNGYSAILICSGGTNTIASKTSDIFIDETKKQLAVTYYNGTSTDKMHYTDINGVDSSIFFPNVTRMFKTEPISSIKIIESNESMVITSDDAEYSSANRIPSHDGYDYQWYPTPTRVNSYLIMSSPEVKDNYIRDSYNFFSMRMFEANVFDNSGYLSGRLTTLRSSGDDVTPSDTNIKNYFYKKNEYFDTYVVSNQIDAKPEGWYPLSTFVTSELNELFKNCTIRIKTNDGIKTFSNLNNLLNITTVNPLYFKKENSNYEIDEKASGNVYPTFAQFVKTPILRFDDEYNNYLSSAFGLDLYDCNTHVYAIESIPQIWFKKYSTSNSSTLYGSEVGAMGLFPVTDVRALKDFWETDNLRIYSDTFTYTKINGMSSGYEKNSFFCSRGLTLKNKNSNKGEISLTKWSGVTFDINANSITLNVTETLVNEIFTSEGYAKNWTGRTVPDSKYKIKYIENSVLPYINIDSKYKIKVSKLPNDNMGFLNYDEALNNSNFEESLNTETELYKESDKYFIRIKNAGNYTYTVKMTISI